MTAIGEMTVGEIAAEHPLATRVFARHNIDYCCGGSNTLADACEGKGVNVAQILVEIERELAGSSGNEKNWNSSPLTELVDHIIKNFHTPLKEEMPRLAKMADKVARVHGDKTDVDLQRIATIVGSLYQELSSHMEKEEQILFPMIKEGRGTACAAPIAVMESEHDEAGDHLEQLRALTEDFVAPSYACATWKALWSGLADLEAQMHEHVHLENNILFPRALAGDS